MRWLVLGLSGLAAVLIIAVVAAVVVLLTRGGIDEEAYRREVRPLLLAWQDNIGLSTLTCGGEPGGNFTEEDVQVLAGVAMALSDIQGDVQAMATPERYKPGVEAMAAVAMEIEALQKDLNALLQAGQEFQRFDPQEALADVAPTPENVSWFVRLGSAFQAWDNDFLKWSNFVDCILPGAPERVGELAGYQRQMEIDLEELNRLRQEGPQEMVTAFAPVFNAIEISTQAFARLSRALERQVEVERVFADVIAGP